MSIETLSKVAMLPKILEAAQLLHELDLTGGVKPNEFVRNYVAKNPEINKLLSGELNRE